MRWVLSTFTVDGKGRKVCCKKNSQSARANEFVTDAMRNETKRGSENVGWLNT